MTDITLKLDERNEVRFDVSITASEKIGGSNGPTVVTRFVCEALDLEYSFPGTIADDGAMQVIIPPMQGKINEGVYDSRLEVIVDGRHFVPMELKTEFAQSMKVVAEGVSVVGQQTKAAGGAVQVTASVKSTPQKHKPLVEKKAQRVIKIKSAKKPSAIALDEMDKLISEL